MCSLFQNVHRESRTRAQGGKWLLYGVCASWRLPVEKIGDLTAANLQDHRADAKDLRGNPYTSMRCLHSRLVFAFVRAWRLKIKQIMSCLSKWRKALPQAHRRITLLQDRNGTFRLAEVARGVLASRRFYEERGETFLVGLHSSFSRRRPGDGSG